MVKKLSNTALRATRGKPRTLRKDPTGAGSRGAYQRSRIDVQRIEIVDFSTIAPGRPPAGRWGHHGPGVRRRQAVRLARLVWHG